MLVNWTNVAAVQICQFLLIIFYGLVVGNLVWARQHLPQTKLAPLWDVIMVLVLVIYAVVLKINFST